MMGGSLWLESEPGRGATFHFTAKVGVRTEAIEDEEAAARAARPAAIAAPQPAGRLRILLAEDNRVNRFLAVRLLEKAGHQVETATNGRAALAALEHDRFDLALMDLQMPEMDGLEATARIRERERTTGSHLPIIALTANAMVGDQERCLQAGMDGYVSKPIDIARLLAEIHRVRAALERQA